MSLSMSWARAVIWSMQPVPLKCTMALIRTLIISDCSFPCMASTM